MDSRARNEGMVAVITGLRDAGLSVTVSDARQLGLRNRRNPVGHATSQGRMRTSSSGVQTCRPPERSVSNTQCHRIAYQPVYQSPISSPPAAASPPASPSPTQGAPIDIQQLEDQLNELRACLLANGQGVSSSTRPRALTSPVRSPSAPIRHPSPADVPTKQLGMVPVRDVAQRSTVNFHRGSTTATCSSSYRRDKASNAFVESLRKYPNTSLGERTLSVDIIQRLLTQAQAKNGSKRSIHVKRVRSMTHHSHEQSCSKRPSTKVYQTARRNDSPTREVIAAVYGTEKKKVLSFEGRDGTPNGRGSMSFECLTNNFAHAHRSTDVRYLSDVTKYVRDTLRQIGHNEDGVCPHMLQRYSAHRREYHQSEAGTLTTDDPDAQASSSTRPKKVCRFNDFDNSIDCKGQSSRNLGENIRMRMVDVKEKLCLICNQPAPCRCDLAPPCPCPENRPSSLKDRLKSLDLCEEFRRLCFQEPIYEDCTCPQDVDETIEDLVDKWLKSIPIYAGYTYNEKLARDETVNALKTNLKQHIGQKLKCQKDIFACMKNLPMWLPPDKEEEKFKEHLGNDLLMKIVNIDLFGSKVRRWVESLPFLPNVAVNTDTISTELARKLKDVAMTTKDLRNDLEQCTYEFLGELPISVCSCIEKEDLAERLTDSLITLPQEVIDNLIYMDDFSSVRKKVNLLEKVKQWVNAIPIDTGVIIDRDEIASLLSGQLDTIVENTEPGELWDAVKRAARRKLEDMKIQGGLTEMEIQAARLANILAPDFFGAVVDKWTKTVAFDHNSNVVRELFAYDLTKKLLASLDNVDPEEAEDVMKNIINDMLNRVPAAGSLSLKAAQASKLASALNKLGSKGSSELKETIKRWIEDVPFEFESENTKKRIINNLSKKIKYIVDNKTPGEIWHAVKNDTMNEIENIPVTCSDSILERHAENLADDIVTCLFDEVVQGWIKSVPFKQDYDMSYAQNIEMKIKKLLNDDALLDDNAIDILKAKINDELPDQSLECDLVEKAKLIEGLVETIRKGPKIKDKVTIAIENWLKNKVPLTSPLNTDKANSIVRRIKTKLNATTPREQWNVLKAAALEELENMPIDDHMLPSEMETIAEDLASSLASDDFEQTVREWANKVDFDSYGEEQVKDFITELTKKLKNVMGTRNIEEARDEMKDTIVNELGEVPTLYDVYQKEEEAEKLLSALSTLKSERDKILAQVEDWFKTVPLVPEPPVNKTRVVKRLAKNIKNKLAQIKPESTWHELKSVAKDELEGLPVIGANPKVEILAEHLANHLVSSMLLDAIRNWITKVPFDLQKNVNKTKIADNLEKKVQKILDANPHHLIEKLTEGIFDSLDNLPVICTKSQKTSLAEELATEISYVPKGKDQFSQTLYEWVQKFPFDPNERVDKSKLALDMDHNFKNIVSEELPEKVRDAIKNDVTNVIQKYKSKCNDAEKEELTDALADKLVEDIFTDTVRRWVSSIPFIPEPPVDIDETSRKLTNKLRPTFTSSKPDKEHIISIIRGELVTLPVDCNPITKNTYLSQISNELFDKLMKCPPEETAEQKHKKLPRATYAINVNEMLKGVTVSLDAEDNEKIVKSTLDKLRTLRAEGKDEAAIRKELKRDIETGVDQVLAAKKTDPQARKNLAKKLYSQVFDAFKDIGGERKKELLPKFSKTIKNWLSAHPEMDIPKNKQIMFIQDLAEKIADEAVGVGTQAVIKNKIMKIISNTIDSINSTIKNDSNLKNTLITALIDGISADMGILSTKAGKKDIKESVYRLEDIKKRENETQADDFISKKRMRSLVLGFSDYNGNELDTSERNRKLIVNDKSALVGDLLHNFEKSAEIPEESYDDGTELPKRLLIKTRKCSKPKTTCCELSTQIESEDILLDNDASKRLMRNKLSKYPQRDFKTKLILTNKATEQLSNCPSISHASRMPNTSKYIKKYEELTPLLPLSSDETLTETKANERVAQNLTDKLRSLEFQSLDNKQFEKEIVSNIEYEMEDIINIDDSTKNKLADNLLLKLLKTIGSVSPPPTKKVKKNRRTSISDIMSDENLEYAIKRDVKDWLNEIADQTNVKGITVNIAEYKEKHEIPENSNSTKAFDFKGNRLNVTNKNKILDKRIETVESTVSSTTYSISTSDDDTNINIERIKKDVTDWIKGILKLCNSNPVEIGKMIAVLTEKLSKVNTLDFNKKEFRKKIRQEIVDKLNYHFKFKGEQMDIETKQILANQLIDRITKSYKDLNCPQKYHDTVDAQKNLTYSPRNTKYKIKKWIEHIPELSYSNHTEKKHVKRLTRTLAKEISMIGKQGLDEKETKRNMLNTISHKLDSTLKIMEKHIDSKVKQNLLDELLHNLTESVRSSSNLTSDNKSELINNIKKNVEEWMESIFGISAKTLEFRKLAGKIIKHLVEILTSCQTLHGKELRNVIIEKIMRELENVYDSKGSSVGMLAKYKLAQKLLDKIIKMIESFQVDSLIKLKNNISILVSNDNKLYDLEENIPYELEDALEKDVTDWIEGFPELNGNTIAHKRENKRIIKDLSKALALLYMKGKDDLDVLKKMQKEIKRQIGKTFFYRGKHLDNSTKNKLVSELLRKIINTNQYHSNSDAGKRNEDIKKYSPLKFKIEEHSGTVLDKDMYQVKPKELYNITNKSTNTFASPAVKNEVFQDSIIWEWIHDYPELSCASDEREQIKYFDGEIKNQSAKEAWINFNEKDKNINESLKFRLGKDLQTSPIAVRTKNDYSFKTPFVDKKCSSLKRSAGQFTTSSSKVFYLEESNAGSVKEISKEVDADTQNKIFDLILNNIDSMDIPKDRAILKKQIVDILMKDADLPEHEATDLAESILSSAEEQTAKATSDEKQLLTILRNEIRKIMSDYPINQNNFEGIESFLMDLEVRRLFEGQTYDNDDEMKAEILKHIQEKGGLSSEDARAMLGQLDCYYDNLVSFPAVQKSVMRIKANTPNYSNLSLADVLSFETKAKEILEDFFDAYVDYPSPEKQKNIDKVVKETITNLGDILEESEDDANINMRGELNKQIRRISLDTAESVTDLVEDVLEDLIDAYRNTKSPKNQNTIDKVPGHVPHGKEEELKYANEVEKVIGNWLDDLPLASNALDDDQFKETMIKDLAGDIIDREKYLQTHPEIKTSEAKERDQLAKKCRVWMKKFLEGDDLKMALIGTDDLIDALRAVSVPKLTADETYFDALQDEILKWAAQLPPNIKPTVDADTMKKHVNNLAKTIESLKGKPDAEEKIRSAIENTLPLIYGDLDDTELKKLGSTLFNTLMNKGFTDDTWEPEIGGSKPTYKGALQKEMLNWTKGLPPHVKPTVDDETMKKYLNDLAKTIETYKGKPDAEEKIRAAIAQTLPMIYGNLNDDELKRMESSLFNTLMNKGFTDDTWEPEIGGSKPTYKGALQKEMLNWTKGLPPHVKPTVDDETMKKYLNDLAKTIETYKGKPDSEEKIRAAIAQTLPMIYGNLNDDELKRMDSSLFNTLMNKGFTDDTWEPEIGGSKPTYKGALQKEMLNWTKGLPPHVKPTVDDETMKKYLNDLAKTIETYKGKPDAEEKIRAAIAQTLPMIYGNLNDGELKRMESSLFNTLMKKGFTDDTWVPELTTGDKPTYMGALQKEILGWVKKLPPNINPTVSNEKMKVLVYDLAKIIEDNKGKPDAEVKIRSAINRVLPVMFEDLDDAELKKLGSTLFNTLMNKGFTDDTWEPQKASEDKITNDVLSWLKQSPMYQKASPEEKKRLEMAAIEMAKELNNTLANLPSGSDVDKLLRDQMKKHLKNIITDREYLNDENFLNEAADNVLNFLKASPSFQELTGLAGPGDLLALAVDNWVNTLPIEVRSPEEEQRLNDAKRILTSRLEQARAQFPPSTPEHGQAIKDEARKFLRSIITDPQKRNDERYIDEEANKLVKLLDMVAIAPSRSLSTIKPYKSPADTLYEYNEDWVNNLPVEGDPEKVNLLKQNLATKLINKIGELNMNPDIFNDTELYQYSLSDEIDKLLDEIPKNPELDKYLPALKKELIFKVLDARQKILDELAGKLYKQQLRDKISTSLPLPGYLTADEQASLDLIKDKLADAFIDLHFADCDGNKLLFNNYKKKISDELNHFCADIFRHYPCARIDVEKVKDDLHRALMKVPVPRDDSMKSEVEQVRIRDIVNDWMMEIPLRQETGSDKLRRYKLAAVLAKHIHDIEMEKQHNDFIDSEHRIREETRKFMNIIPIREDRQFLFPDLIQRLINRLHCSEQSRRFISSERCQTQDFASLCSPRPPLSSTLCTGDQTNLTLEEKRSPLYKDALVCTPVKDSCSQTCHSVHPTISQKSCAALSQKKNASCMTQKESPCHMPRVTVKEYVWDSTETCTGAYEYSPPYLQRSCSQGVQACPPQFANERNLASTPSCMEQEISPYKVFPPCSVSQRPSMYIPLTPENPPVPAQKSSYSPYNSCSGLPRQSNQFPMQPQMNDRSKNSDCYCPPFEERDTPFKNPQSISTEDHSEEEWPYAGPSNYFRRLPEDKMAPCLRRRQSRCKSPGRCDGEDFWSACWRQRGRPVSGYRADKIKDKCDCKERIWMTCKGRQGFMDMCQACGTTCPHPRPFLFAPNFCNR